MEEDDELLAAPKTRAELVLQHLLERQLDTSGRLEQVEFEGASRCVYRGIHGCGGVSSLAEFISNKEGGQPVQVSDEQGRFKRKRYGPDPAFMESEQRELERSSSKASSLDVRKQLGRHEKELEISLIQGKGRLQAIAHLTVEDVSIRKPLIELSEEHKRITPQDRIRLSAGRDATRSASEVFSTSAPTLLDLNSYLEEKRVAESSSTVKGETPTARPQSVSQVPEEEIVSNRLSLTELREWSGGKLRSYVPGAPSNVLYLKNLSSEVTETDLASLFLRYQKDEQINFRLMQRGRMKGQAFVTLPDQATASQARELLNGYMLKQRPMVIEFARQKQNS